MKKLIDVAAVNEMKNAGKTIVYIDADTLLTPAARDPIETNGMTIQDGKTPVPEVACCGGDTENSPEHKIGSVNAELIFKVLSCLQEKGILNELLDFCEKEKKPYDSECDAAGFKLVKGRSIKMQELDTGNPDQKGKVNYQEIISAEDGSSGSAGMISIDNVKFDWLTECQEIYHIVSGCITVTIDGKEYRANEGDTFFIKEGVKCAFGAKGLGKAFYVTYE